MNSLSIQTKNSDTPKTSLKICCNKFIGNYLCGFKERSKIQSVIKNTLCVLCFCSRYKEDFTKFKLRKKSLRSEGFCFGSSIFSTLKVVHKVLHIWERIPSNVPVHWREPQADMCPKIDTCRVMAPSSALEH